MNPEEKLAKRLLERHNIQPPYDLNKLASNYANLHFVDFPFDVKADGMSVNLKKFSAPDIYINTSQPTTRRKFSIAHELGHVLIPWHKGNIVSHSDQHHTNCLPSAFYNEYWEIEREANRFASELLLPTSWVCSKLKDISSNNFQSTLQEIINEAGTSRDASLIKIFSVLRAGFICVEINDSGKVVNSFGSNGTPVYKLQQGTNCFESEPYIKYNQKSDFVLGDKKYILWLFDTKIELPIYKDNRSWRNVLNDILDDTLLHDKKQSINAILPAVYQSHKSKEESIILSNIIHRYSQKDDLKSFVRHPLSEQYIVKRMEELKNRQA
ncbi:MAG: hypothetical protein RLZZ04_713 [Cyanobacteriota bacterium]|jgi:Zn-dependent peptidase ImmA (M78 family)